MLRMYLLKGTSLITLIDSDVNIMVHVNKQNCGQHSVIIYFQIFRKYSTYSSSVH